MQPKIDMEEIKGWCREVGEYQLDNFQKRIDVSSKEQKINLVSEVDEKSEEMLLEAINSAYPDHAVLAEEGGAEEGDSDYRWVVDPLDGTVNYVHGLPIFAISLALFLGEKAELAVIYLPCEDTLYTARRGQGSYRQDERLEVSSSDNLATSLLATGFPYDHQDESDEVLGYFSRILPEVGGIRRSGSAVYDLCQVARGTFAGFWEIKLEPWDIAAGALIVKEAGGLVTDFSGREISSSGREVAAAAPGVHGRLLELLNPSG